MQSFIGVFSDCITFFWFVYESTAASLSAKLPSSSEPENIDNMPHFLCMMLLYQKVNTYLFIYFFYQQSLIGSL